LVIEGATEMRAYLQYVRDESKKCFDAEPTSLDASMRIEFGPYGKWRAEARLNTNVERAYREFRNDPPDAPWDPPATFDAIYQAAKTLPPSRSWAASRFRRTMPRSPISASCSPARAR
jgi:hypothetical protein